MFLRAWITIIFLGLCSYGAWSILNGNVPAYEHSEIPFVLYMIAPWALLYGSIKAWHQNFVWRRMLAKRQTPPVLSRGQVRNTKSSGRTSMLERICSLLLLLAIAAILKQFSITDIEWWIGSLVGAYFILRRALKRAG